MNTAEVRSNLQKYHSHTATFQLAEFFGKRPKTSLEEIEETFADLYSASTIEGLESSAGESFASNEIEKRATENLLNIARIGFLKNQSREISDEIRQAGASVRVNFRNQVFEPAGVIERIGIEFDPQVRSEIFDRSIDAENNWANLRVEKLRQRQENVKKLGFEVVPELFETVTGLDFQNLAKNCRKFLESTDETYFHLLREVSAEAGFARGSLSHADLHFLREKIDRKSSFPGRQIHNLYVNMLENCGFSEGRVPQVIVKKISAAKRTSYFATNLPDELFLLVSVRGGSDNYLDFFQKFGTAQKDAWTSKELVERYPEFVFAPEQVAGKGYGFLFQGLLADPLFMQSSFFSFEENLQARIIREANFQLLFNTRREVIRFLTELDLFSKVTINFEEAFQAASQSFSETLGFEFRKERVIFEISDDFAAQANVRALVFASGLREYLRERHDLAWWNKRSCFEELIDFWNTAERYRVEELAGSIGFEMSFDLLAEMFSAALKPLRGI